MPKTASQAIPLAQARQLARPEYRSLIIGCGRRAARVSAALRQRLGPSISNIQILNPVTSNAKRMQMWDWLLIPEHDGVRGANVIHFHGALVKPISAAPRAQTHLVILLGAPSKNLPWQVADLDTWLAQARRQDKPVIICPSRRTTDAVLAHLQQQADNNWEIIAATDSTAYRQALVQAAEFWVSGDSINMLAEACTSQQAIKILGRDKANGKLVRYFSELDRLGRTTSKQALPEVKRVAQQLIRRGALLL